MSLQLTNLSNLNLDLDIFFDSYLIRSPELLVGIFYFLHPTPLLTLEELSLTEIQYLNSIKSKPSRLLRTNQLLYRRKYLGRWIGLDPKNVPLKFSDLGHPTLDDPYTKYNFSISHSGNYWAIALSYSVPVGLDIEPLDTHRNIQLLTKRVLHPEEMSIINSLNDASKHDFFIKCWTHKEAIGKQKGLGIQSNFKSINTLDSTCLTGTYKSLRWSLKCN